MVTFYYTKTDNIGELSDNRSKVYSTKTASEYFYKNVLYTPDSYGER